MKSFKTVLVGVLLLLACKSAYPRTWYVTPGGSGDVPTIQAAVDTAAAGDDVLLAPGTYSWTDQCGSAESMVIMKSGVWLHSETGAAGTVLDAQWCGRVLLCDGVDPSARIQGLTITRGGSRWVGGGILCKGGSAPEIVDNVILNCSASPTYLGVGGGIACTEGSSPDITNNVVRSCGAYRGGGIYCGGSSEPKITGNEIIDNCTQPPELDWQTYGGGIQVESSSPLIKQNTIEANVASYGAGINCWDSTLEIDSNLIKGNFAYSDGAAIWCNGGTIYAFWNTLVANEVWEYSWDDGGAVGCEHSSTFYVMCNIIEGTITGPAISCGHGGEMDVRSNDFWNNDEGDANCEFSGEGNLHEDPLFCDPEAGDYTLSEDSPCLDEAFGLCMSRIGAFGSGCVATPVERTSWGRVKALYRR